MQVLNELVKFLELHPALLLPLAHEAERPCLHLFHLRVHLIHQAHVLLWVAALRSLGDSSQVSICLEVSYPLVDFADLCFQILRVILLSI